MDGSDVQILDMRSPGQPVIELRGHRSQVNAMGWSTTDRPLLATAGMYISAAGLGVAFTRLACRRRLSGVALGPGSLHSKCDVASCGKLASEFTKAGREEAGRDGPYHGVFCDRGGDESGVVPTDTWYDDEHGPFHCTWRVAGDHERKVYQNVESVMVNVQAV